MNYYNYILLSIIFYSLNIEPSHQQELLFRQSASSWIAPLTWSSETLKNKIKNEQPNPEALRKFKADLEIKIETAKKAFYSIQQKSDSFDETKKNILNEFNQIIKNAESLTEEVSKKLDTFDQK